MKSVNLVIVLTLLMIYIAGAMGVDQTFNVSSIYDPIVEVGAETLSTDDEINVMAMLAYEEMLLRNEAILESIRASLHEEENTTEVYVEETVEEFTTEIYEEEVIEESTVEIYEEEIVEETTTEVYEEPTVEIIVTEPVEVIIRTHPFTDYEIYELAKIIMCEAEGESQYCKEFIGQVVVNRIYSNKFPNTMHDVIFQKNQFTPTFDGRWEKVEPNQACYDAAYKVVNSIQPLTNALYFEACKPGVISWHSKNLIKVAEIDSTRFYIE